MLSLTTLVAVSMFGTAATALTQPLVSGDTTPVQVAIRGIAPEPTPEPRFICKDCSLNEIRTLAFLQGRGITDRNALATIMGNIKQESTFRPNVCEGGSIASYENCRYGGYGLIQFTCESRYRGLGRHAYSQGMNPSTLEAQLSYMVTEEQWKGIEDRMKTPGKSVDRYMNYAYSWIGWGIHGARTKYAYDYARRLTLSET